VNLDDADITIFSLNDLSSIQANLDAVSVGATEWAAKVNNYDWNIYRCVQVPGYIDHVCDNLDGTSICNFTQPHGLAVGDKLIIKFFDVEIDGITKKKRVVEKTYQKAMSGDIIAAKAIMDRTDGTPVANVDVKSGGEKLPQAVISPAFTQIAQEYEQKILDALKKTN
jgi:hypothetical protein